MSTATVDKPSPVEVEGWLTVVVAAEAEVVPAAVDVETWLEVEVDLMLEYVEETHDFPLFTLHSKVNSTLIGAYVPPWNTTPEELVPPERNNSINPIVMSCVMPCAVPPPNSNDAVRGKESVVRIMVSILTF